MTKTVTSLFHDQHKANSAVSRLEQAGISRSDVDVFTGTADDLADKLAQYGVPASDAQSYAEGVRRGGALVTVSCDDDEVDQVVSLLEDDGVLDLGERESLQAEGPQGRDRLTSGTTTGLGAAVGAAGAALTGSSGASGTTGDLTGSSEVTRARGDLGTTGGREDEVIPIAEEELHVGKREVSHGRVRIHSHVVERPVQEQVTLRDETVDVERRPASGRSGTLSGDPFQECLSDEEVAGTE